MVILVNKDIKYFLNFPKHSELLENLETTEEIPIIEEFTHDEIIEGIYEYNKLEPFRSLIYHIYTNYNKYSRDEIFNLFKDLDLNINLEHKFLVWLYVKLTSEEKQIIFYIKNFHIMHPITDKFTFLISPYDLRTKFNQLCLYTSNDNFDIIPLIYKDYCSELKLTNLFCKTACEIGNLQLLKWLENKGLPIYNSENLYLSCINNQLEIAKYLYEKEKIDFNLEEYSTFSIVCEKGYLEMAKWIYSINKINIREKKGICLSLSYSNLDMVQWIYSLKKIKISELEYIYRRSFINNIPKNKEHIEWLYSIIGDAMFNSGKFCLGRKNNTVEGVILYLEMGNYNFSDFVFKNIINGLNSFNNEDEHLEFIKELIDKYREYEPHKLLFNSIIGSGNYKLFEWYIEKYRISEFPEENLYLSIDGNNYKIFKYYFDKIIENNSIDSIFQKKYEIPFLIFSHKKRNFEFKEEFIIEPDEEDDYYGYSESDIEYESDKEEGIMIKTMERTLKFSYENLINEIGFKKIDKNKIEILKFLLKNCSCIDFNSLHSNIFIIFIKESNKSNSIDIKIEFLEWLLNNFDIDNIFEDEKNNRFAFYYFCQMERVYFEYILNKNKLKKENLRKFIKYLDDEENIDKLEKLEILLKFI